MAFYDELSDAFKKIERMRVDKNKLPDITIGGWFVNLEDGPQFFNMPFSIPYQALYTTPVNDTQKPSAWYSARYSITTTDRSFYRPDINWLPLYLARDVS